MNALGIHLVLELKDCPAELLDNLPFVQQALLNAAHAMGATVVGETFHKFSPQGVTGVVAIAESHLCIHTWPEYKYAAVDIFCCGDRVDPHIAANDLIVKFAAGDSSVIELKRGVLTTAIEIAR